MRNDAGISDTRALAANGFALASHCDRRTSYAAPQPYRSSAPDPALTAYDEQHAITYMRMLDADAEGADWREVARIVLHIDSDRDPD